LEIRLDNVLFRRGFALTLPHARQIVNHGKVKVDRKLVTVSSYFCFVGQVIEVCSDPEISSTRRITGSFCDFILRRCRTRRSIPRYLKEVSLREVKVDSRAGRIDFQIKFKELLVIEYYSKRLLLNALKKVF
jgi:small subunit ribosomal protein S4